MAEVVATTHDAYETAHSVATDALRHDVAVSLSLREFYVDGIGTHLALRNHIRQVEIAVWSANQVGIVVLDEVILHARILQVFRKMASASSSFSQIS